MSSKQEQKIVGASITKYLLEKSRVTKISVEWTQLPHFLSFTYWCVWFFFVGIFIYLLFMPLQGADEMLLKDLHLMREASNYEYLKASGCFSVDTINDCQLFLNVQKSFQ